MNVVTGAFSYTGRFIAGRLRALGEDVVTLSRSPAPPGSSIPARPLQFADEEALTESLRGADVLYNTYWIRFGRDGTGYERAVENSRKLFAAARRAGVERVVHLSVTNADAASPFPYFRGKAAVERALRESGLSYAIVRPTWIFGPDDILVNNLAWLLRRFPLFVLPGTGAYRVQPISIAETAALAVDAARSEEDLVFDAAGPETLAFAEVVDLVARATCSRTALASAPPRVALGLTKALSLLTRDVVLTREELGGLMAELLVSTEPPRGRIRFSSWIDGNGSTLGRSYVSELARNFRPYAPI